MAQDAQEKAVGRGGGGQPEDTVRQVTSPALSAHRLLQGTEFSVVSVCWAQAFYFQLTRHGPSCNSL